MSQRIFTNGLHSIYSYLTTREWLDALQTCHYWSAAANTEPSRNLPCPIHVPDDDDEHSDDETLYAKEEAGEEEEPEEVPKSESAEVLQLIVPPSRIRIRHFTRLLPPKPKPDDEDEKPELRSTSEFCPLREEDEDKNAHGCYLTCEQLMQAFLDFPFLTEIQVFINEEGAHIDHSKIKWPKQLTKVVWFIDDAKGECIPDFIRSLCANCPTVRDLTLRYEWVNDWSTFKNIPLLKNLERFTVRPRFPEADHDFLEKCGIQELPQSLKFLDIARGEFNMETFFQCHLPALTEINLSHHDLSEGNQFERLSRCAPNLVVLNPHYLCAEELHPLSSFKSLAMLEFCNEPMSNFTHHCNETEVVEAVGACTQLTHLMFNGWAFEKEESWTALEKLLPRVTKLSFGRCSEYELPHKLLAWKNRVTHLHLDKCTKDEKDGSVPITDFVQFSELESLSFDYSMHQQKKVVKFFIDEAPVYHIQVRPVPEKNDYKGNTFRSIKDFFDLIPQLPKLKHVRVFLTELDIVKRKYRKGILDELPLDALSLHLKQQKLKS